VSTATPSGSPHVVAPGSLGLGRVLIAAWGALGVVMLLAQAIHRLGGLALEAHRMPLSTFEVGVSVLWVGMNAYLEGYRAFQQRFSPRVVARALHLARNPKPLFVLFAPLYCMAFFHATRRARTIAWATTVMVLGFIVLLRQVPQPWRGIVDGGVVVALIWGAGAIIVHFVRAFALGREPSQSPQLPAP
jgi:hypothetical protein